MKCKKCGSCCRYIILPLPSDLSEDELFWLNSHEGVIDSIRGHVVIKTRCKYLTKNNLCSIYDNRPRTCREAGKKDCKIVRELVKSEKKANVTPKKPYIIGELKNGN